MIALVFIADYQTPDWVDIAGDVGVVIGAVMAVIGFIAVVVKVTRYFDKKKDERFAASVATVVQPMIDAATESIRPGARTEDGESLADVAAHLKSASSDIRGLRTDAVRRDGKIAQLGSTLKVLDDRSRSMEQRQIEMEVREERIEDAAKRAVDERDRMVTQMVANGDAVWDALQGLGVEMPAMERPDTTGGKT